MQEFWLILMNFEGFEVVFEWNWMNFKIIKMKLMISNNERGFKLRKIGI